MRYKLSVSIGARRAPSVDHNLYYCTAFWEGPVVHFLSACVALSRQPKLIRWTTSSLLLIFPRIAGFHFPRPRRMKTSCSAWE